MLRSRWLAIACLLAPAGALAAPASPVQALHQQIAALQLDHALNLTRPQAQALLPLLQDARSKVQTWKSQRASQQPALTAALQQAVSDLQAIGTVSAATAQAVQAARGGAPGTMRQDMHAFWQQAKQVLTADQLAALRTAPLGVGMKAATASAPAGQHGGGRPGRRFRVMHALLSDDFVQLVQARAG